MRYLPSRRARRPRVTRKRQIPSTVAGRASIDLRGELRRFEDEMIRQALTASSGNKNKAAKILGLNRTTLVEKLRRMRILEDSMGSP